MLIQLMHDDKILWKLLKSGDSQALETIYKLHAKALYRYGMRFASHTEQVNDSLHDVFVELWQKRLQLTPEINNIRFYLLKSLRNRLLRAFETHKRTVLTDDISSYQFDAEQSLDDVFIQNETDEQLKSDLAHAISRLSTRQREALYLRFNQNLSYEEIAQIMSVEQQSAYNLIFRAIESLRKHFGFVPIWLILVQLTFILLTIKAQKNFFKIF